VTSMLVLAGVLAVALLCYLVAALLDPEKFS
jgi:K+-transporting ATPase KdpF subunit